MEGFALIVSSILPTSLAGEHTTHMKLVLWKLTETFLGRFPPGPYQPTAYPSPLRVPGQA